MVATSPSDDARSIFETALLRAITQGEMPPLAVNLGVGSCAAIEAIALQHPEAAIELIADAYDIFEREIDIAA